MLPTSYIVLDSLPVTPNGKIDRRALPDPAEWMVPQVQSLAAPRTATEHALADIWQTLLGLSQIDITANFFTLGGHSLLATQVINRVRQTWAIDLPVRVLFEQPTIAALAHLIDQTQTDTTFLPIQTVNRQQPLPLSFAQQRLWFLAQLEPTSPAYHITLPLRIQGLLDKAALIQSFHAVIQRHESLRTSFSWDTVTHQPIQIIRPAYRLDIPVIDLQGLDPNTRAIVVQEVAMHHARRPFDLTQGPMMRLMVVHQHPTEYVLLLAMHHIVSDGWSLGILVREVTTLYQATVQGQAITLTSLPVQYVDYAVWQRQWWNETVRSQHRAYWKQQLAKVAPLNLPTDYARPAQLSYRGATHPLAFEEELTEQLHALSQQTGTTLFMTLLTAFALLLARYSGQMDITIGTPIAGRAQAEVEPLIGFFVNILVLRMRLDAHQTSTTLLQQIRETTLAAYAHQMLPFEELVEELQPERDLSRSPLFQVLFALQNTPVTEVRLPDIHVEPLGLGELTAKFDLEVHLHETHQRLSGHMTYATDLFEASTIERWGNHYKLILDAMVTKPMCDILELPLLTSQERQQILFAWNDTYTAYPPVANLPQLCVSQAHATPDAVALVYLNQHLTYDVLHQRTNQLAQYLQDQGVMPEVHVGVCIARSLDLMIALLGIVKAGAAYVPLDPDYPADRLAFMCQDARIPVLLTHNIEPVAQVVQEVAAEMKRSMEQNHNASSFQIIAIDTE